MARKFATLLDRILSDVAIGTEIPKPAARAPFRLKGEGIRRGERAIVYSIPSHSNEHRSHEKGITVSGLEKAYSELLRCGEITRIWFNTHLKACAREGACNFTTIGGLLELLREAEYQKRGTYRRVGN